MVSQEADRQTVQITVIASHHRISGISRDVGTSTRLSSRLSENVSCISASKPSRYQSQFGVVGNWRVVAALHSFRGFRRSCIPECNGAGINRTGAWHLRPPSWRPEPYQEGSANGCGDRNFVMKSQQCSDKQLREHSPNLRILFLISDHRIGRFFVFC